jgi:hypothetical protein
MRNPERQEKLALHSSWPPEFLSIRILRPLGVWAVKPALHPDAANLEITFLQLPHSVHFCAFRGQSCCPDPSTDRRDALVVGFRRMCPRKGRNRTGTGRPHARPVATAQDQPCLASIGRSDLAARDLRRLPCHHSPNTVGLAVPVHSASEHSRPRSACPFRPVGGLGVATLHPTINAPPNPPQCEKMRGRRIGWTAIGRPPRVLPLRWRVPSALNLWRWDAADSLRLHGGRLGCTRNLSANYATYAQPMV